MAKDAGCETVAFPLISAGVYGYPKDQAFKVAVDTIKSFLEANDMEVLGEMVEDICWRNAVRYFGFDI